MTQPSTSKSAKYSPTLFPLVVNLNVRLRLDAQAAASQFDHHGILVDLFEKPMPQSIVNPVERRHDLLRDIDMLHQHGNLSLSSRSSSCRVDPCTQSVHAVRGLFLLEILEIGRAHV